MRTLSIFRKLNLFRTIIFLIYFTSALGWFSFLMPPAEVKAATSPLPREGIQEVDQIGSEVKAIVPLQFIEEQSRIGGTIENLFPQFPYIFVSRNDATVIYDVSDINNPIEIETLPQFVAKAKAGDYLYGENWHTHQWEIWDVRNPTTPIKVNSTTILQGSFVNATSDYLFLQVRVATDSIIRAYSLSNPRLPILVGEWKLGVASDYVQTSVNWSVFYKDHLFIGFYTVYCTIRDCTPIDSPVAILNITTPTEPIRFVEGSHRLSSRVAFGSQNQYLYQIEESYYPSQLYIYELNVEAGTVELLSTYPLNDFNPQQITLNNSVLYLATSEGTKILDISNPVAPVEIGMVPVPMVGVIENEILFRFSRLHSQPYSSAYSPYLTIFDLKNPTTPLLASTVYHVYGEEIIQNDDYLYVIDKSEHPSYPFTIHTIDSTSPQTLTLVRTDPFTNSETLRDRYRSTATVIKNGYLYLQSNGTELEENLFIYRLPTATTSLTLLRSLNSPIQNSITVSGNSLLMAGIEGKDIYDITDPTNPVLASQLALQPYGSTVIEGNYAYIGHMTTPTDTAIYIVNVADPYDPVIVGSLNAKVNLDGLITMDVEDGYLYYLQAQGVSIADVTNPTLPYTISEFMPVMGRGITVHQERLYLTEMNGQTYNLATYNVQEPASPKLWSMTDTLSPPIADFLLTNNKFYGVGRYTGGVSMYGFVNTIPHFLPLLQNAAP